MTAGFDFERFQDVLVSLGGAPARNVIVHQEVDSTSTDLKRRIENGARPGTVVAARRQTSGRGRRGREWFSSDTENLYMSVSVSIKGDAADTVPLIPLAAGVAARDAILDESGVSASLKWPNDLLVEGRKIAGILTELATVSPKRGGLVIVGIGVNTGNVVFPAELEAIAASIPAITGSTADASAIAARFVHLLEEWTTRIEKGERTALVAAWRERAEPFGRRVRVGALEGVTRDMAPDGRLLVVKDNGEEVSVVGGIVENL